MKILWIIFFANVVLAANRPEQDLVEIRSKYESIKKIEDKMTVERHDTASGESSEGSSAEVFRKDGTKRPFSYAKASSRYLVEKPKIDTAERLANLAILLMDTEIPRLERELQRLHVLNKRRVPLHGVNIGSRLHRDPKAIQQYGFSGDSNGLYLEDLKSTNYSNHGTVALSELHEQIRLDQLIIEAALHFRGVKRILSLDALCSFSAEQWYDECHSENTFCFKLAAHESVESHEKID